MTRLIVVRHGQSEANKERTFAGHRNVNLTELGKAQAEVICEYLKEYDIDKIYSSSLSRAIETVAPTARRLNKEIILMDDLKEIYAGKWEGMFFDDIERTYKESFYVWRNDIGNAHPDGGESVKELFKRVSLAIDKIVSENEGRTVLVVSHGTAIRTLSCLWHGKEIKEMKDVLWAPNSSVSVIDYENGKPEIVLFGYTDFLGDKANKMPANV